MLPLENISIQEDWLQHAELQKLFDLLTADNGEAMVAGGAVRNSLMGQPVADVDLCTTLLPQEVMDRVAAAGHKAIPTGIDHGTVTVVVNGTPFEVTTLREDVETDGRHAQVRFGTDWEADALRRDLTINGLYCDRNGQVFDFVDGYGDVVARNVRFIGDAGVRISEDALRILRFFRFFAWYGDGRPDAAGLKACNAEKERLGGLSAERIWMELKKLLTAPDPGRALLWMRTTGILGGLLPETAKWGIDAIPGLIRLEQEQHWEPEPIFRLMAMVRPDVETVTGLADRLLFSNVERERLTNWAASSAPLIETTDSELEMLLYRGSQTGLTDAMKLEVVHLRNRDEEDASLKMVKMIGHALTWRKPEFPVKGRDLLEAGFVAGPDMGEKLALLEEQWIESGFTLGRDKLLAGLTCQ